MSLIWTFLSPFGIFDCLWAKFPPDPSFQSKLQNVEITFKETCPGNVINLGEVKYKDNTVTFITREFLATRKSPKLLKLDSVDDISTDICIVNVFRLLTYEYSNIQIQRLQIAMTSTWLVTAVNHHAVKFLNLCETDSTIGFEQAYGKKHIAVTSPDLIGANLKRTKEKEYTDYGGKYDFTEDHARLLIGFEHYRSLTPTIYDEEPFEKWNWPKVPYSLLSSVSSRIGYQCTTQSGNCQTLSKLFVKFPAPFQKLATDATKWGLYSLFSQSVIPMSLQIILDNTEPLRNCCVANR